MNWLAFEKMHCTPRECLRRMGSSRELTRTMAHFRAEHEDYEKRRQLSDLAAAMHCTVAAAEAMLDDLTPEQRALVLSGESLGDVPTMDGASSSAAPAGVTFGSG